MNFFDSIITLFKRSGTTTKEPAPGAEKQEISAPRRGLPFPVMAGGSAQSVATVFRCVNLLADSVANLPMQFMKRKGEIFVSDVNNSLHYLLTVQPCPHLSAVDFWAQLVRYLLLKGNAYVIPVYSTVAVEIDRLVLVNPDAVSHDTVNDEYYVNDLTAGISGVYDEDEIIHIKNYSLDGKKGISTLAYARTTTDIAATGDRETLNRFSNGGNVRGIVSNDTSVRGFGEYQDSELAKTATDLDDRFRTGERIVSLPGQVQFSPISLSSTDMQFLESRKFTVREICRFFGVHPSFVFDDTSNNYKSAETANVAFLSTTLNPILRKIENELLRKLVPSTLCCKRKFEFDRRGLYACDLESRVKYQMQTISAGIYTVNDWRRRENQPAVEGGDVVLVSANLKDINDHTAAVNEPKNEPNNEPKEPKEDGEEE